MHTNSMLEKPQLKRFFPLPREYFIVFLLYLHQKFATYHKEISYQISVIQCIENSFKHSEYFLRSYFP